MPIILQGKLQAITHKPQTVSKTSGEVIPETWRLAILEETPTELKIANITVKDERLLEPWKPQIGKMVQIPIRLFSPEKSGAIYYSLA